MERASFIRTSRLESAVAYYETPKGKEHHTTRLWALCEQVGAVTGTKPNRWLRFGEWTLQRALNDLKDKGNVRKRAAYLTWAVKFYAADKAA